MSAVILRICGEADQPAVRRLAERDCASPPTGTILGAEVDGELRAAIILESGTAIADPFHPTAALVELLRTRAAQLRPAQDRVGDRRRALSRVLTTTGGSSERRPLEAPLTRPGS